MKLVAVIVGLMFLAGVLMALRRRAFVRSAVRVRARIVDRNWHRTRKPMRDSFESRINFYAVEFKDLEGRVQRVNLRTGIGEPLHETLTRGDGLLPILYDPRNPAAAQVDAGFPLYVVPAYLCAPAVLFIVLVVYVYFAY